MRSLGCPYPESPCRFFLLHLIHRLEHGRMVGTSPLSRAYRSYPALSALKMLAYILPKGPRSLSLV